MLFPSPLPYPLLCQSVNVGAVKKIKSFGLFLLFFRLFYFKFVVMVNIASADCPYM